jgi:hypothetical protein
MLYLVRKRVSLLVTLALDPGLMNVYYAMS